MSDINDFGDTQVFSPKAAELSNDVPESSSNEKKEKVPTRCQWSLVGPDTYMGVGKTYDKLVSGAFDISSDRGEPIFIHRAINVDGIINFPDSQSDKILNEISGFWERGHLFKKYGFLHRRGYLLYGPAGSGKTMLVQQTIRRIIHAEGIVFMCGNPKIFCEGLKAYRQIEKNRQVVCVFEDIDTIVANYGEDAILSVLDGENQIDKVLNIATTNYPERLDKRIVARPRRFDRVMKIGMPKPEVRKLYFAQKLQIEAPELDIWVEETEGFSFAAMAELVVSTKCLGNEFADALKKIRKLMLQKPSSEEDNESLGFK